MGHMAARVKAGRVIAGVTRQFISRDRNTIWITEETAEKIGVDASAE